MKKRFVALSFEAVKFIDLFNDWWNNHGSKTRSKFQYRTPRVITRFGKMKAARSPQTRCETSSRLCGRRALLHPASTSATRFCAVSSTVAFASRSTTRTR
jgi:hypothetical protein